MQELNEWGNFYVMAGSSAGALIGLQFVVLTLVADRPQPASGDAGAAFATPTIVHFCAVLFLSAVILAPWHTITPVVVLWVLLALSCAIYAVIVVKRMRRQTAYKPVLEDWVYHAVLPLATYLVMGISAYAARAHTHVALFGVGAAALLLLFIGIHNAWDAVVYNVFVNRGSSTEI